MLNELSLFYFTDIVAIKDWKYNYLEDQSHRTQHSAPTLEGVGV